jgi:preprotein translocase SecE subunit
VVKKSIQFLRESREELRKVTWPDKDEVTNFTIVVIVAVFIMSMFLWFVDTGLMKIIEAAMQ